MKRLLLVGSNASASWRIRGEQLGRALGASLSNFGDPLAGGQRPDLAIVVKRPNAGAVARLRAAGVPIVWDIVDAWPQPIGNWWERDVCVQWLKREIKAIRPAAVVASTSAMASDLSPFGLPTLVLPHHARPGLERATVRPEISRVGYEGGQSYINGWFADIDGACRKRGWRFDPKPPSVSALDIVVAVRDADGYAAKNWKSNVKLANAQAAGVPCVLNRERGYLETASGAELWADTPVEMESAFDTLSAENGARSWRSELMHAKTPRIEAIAAQYRTWLESL